MNHDADFYGALTVGQFPVTMPWLHPQNLRKTHLPSLNPGSCSAKICDVTCKVTPTGRGRLCVRMVVVMRIKSSFVRLVPCLILAGLPAHAAQAESFLSKLFGWGSAPAERPASATPKPVPSLGSFSRSSPARSGQTQWSRSYEDDDGGEDYGGAYRTLCVRTCDGYYFPISGSASSRRFSRDTRQCQAMCGSEARLFYLPRGSDDVKNMTDTSGRVYGRLPTAFAYRKALVNGCSCKPMPWSSAETARHQHYALIDTLDIAQQRNAELARVAASETAAGDTEEPVTSASVALKLAEAIAPQPSAAPQLETIESVPEKPNSEPLEISQAAEAAPIVMGHLLPAELQLAVAEDPVVAPAASVQRSRKTSGRSGKSAVSRPTQTASWFGAQPKYAWPGDAPARRR